MRKIIRGKEISAKSIRKMRDTKIAREGKKVLMSKDGGRTWILFPSMSEASRQENIQKSSISSCYQGRSPHFRGILFKPYT